MIYCSRCGAQLADNATVCTQCKEEVKSNQKVSQSIKDKGSKSKILINIGLVLIIISGIIGIFLSILTSKHSFAQTLPMLLILSTIMLALSVGMSILILVKKHTSFAFSSLLKIVICIVVFNIISFCLYISINPLIYIAADILLFLGLNSQYKSDKGHAIK